MPFKHSIRDRKIALRTEHVFFCCANPPQQRQLSLLHGQCVKEVFCIGQAGPEQVHRVNSKQVRLRPPHIRLPARPRERAKKYAVVILLVQATRVPQFPLRFYIQIVLLGLVHQNLRLLRQARNVREARGPTARAPTHETLLRFPVDGLRANIARLPLCVVRARLDRLRYGFLVFLGSMGLLCPSTSLNFLADLVMAAFFPVLCLADWATVKCFAAAALLGRVWQRGGAHIS